MSSKHNSKILKVYEQCQKILKLKRGFVENIQVPPVPNSQSENSYLRDYCPAYYLKVAAVKFFQEASERHKLYQKLDYNKLSAEKKIHKSIERIKNTKELTSKHEQFESELDEMKRDWEQHEEPLVYYEINERNKLKQAFLEKFQSYKEGQSGLKNVKNPHFLHQLISQLKENMEEIYSQDRKSDLMHEEASQKISRYLKELSREMEVGISDIYCRSYIFEQKKKLFSQFVEYQDVKSSKSRLNYTKLYFEQLILISKDIKQHFKRMIKFTDDIIDFFRQLLGFLKEQRSRVEKDHQNFISETLKNKEIGILLRVDIQERINNNLKAIFSLSELIKIIPDWLQDYRQSLTECYSEASGYHERYQVRETKFRETDSFEEMLIEHKGYFSRLEKKEQRLNKENIECLKKFVRDLHELMRLIHQENGKNSRFRSEVNLHEVLNKIFAEYDFEEHTSSSEYSFSRESQDAQTQQKIKEYQNFIDSIEIFDFNTVDWNTNYFSCSLGPKLLIHGYMQNLEEGIYFESSFNKKNYFFGKTRIFVPKKDIYEVSKETALLIFPDVVVIKTNKGELSFHTLGKRDKMYESLITTYFPEVPQSQDGSQVDLEFQFNEFKGEDTSHKKAFHLKPYSIDMGTSRTKKSDLRTIFRRYLSDDPFTYQGTQHKNFKKYTLELVGGLNADTNEITPPSPYYFMKKGETVSESEVPEYSVRLGKFEKKVPMIPFVSKGGLALCEETSTYYWGNPDFLVIDISSVMKGFKLTEGMEIKLLCVYKYQKELDEISCSMSADIIFEREGALNGTIKNEALNELKQVVKTINEAMIRSEKNRTLYKNKGKNINSIDEEKQDFKDEIQKLKDANQKLNKKMYTLCTVFGVLYVITIIFLSWNSTGSGSTET